MLDVKDSVNYIVTEQRVGPAARRHPLVTIPEAKVWRQGKGVVIQKLHNFGITASHMHSSLRLIN